MKKFEKILPWLKDKYVLSIIVFLVWMTFFDRNDFISQYSYKQELNKLEVDKQYYLAQVEENKVSIYELMSDPANLEKFAREKYHMKKDDEDVFLIIRK
ncbi:MAG: cell division protein FtsL [Bacteroidota bacterium]|nr:cell division protein FtsL [Bacteroidota bacterium]